MTTFAATAIAHDTGHGLVREELCRYSIAGVRHWLLEVDVPVVVQAPFAAPVCHQLRGVFVVYMIRPIEEIKASQQRMFLPEDDPWMPDLDGGPVQWGRMEAGAKREYHTDEGDIAEVKYRSWRDQKERCRHLELHTHELEDHPLFIPAADRKSFHVRQVHAVG